MIKIIKKNVKFGILNNYINNADITLLTYLCNLILENINKITYNSKIPIKMININLYSNKNIEFTTPYHNRISYICRYTYQENTKNPIKKVVSLIQLYKLDWYPDSFYAEKYKEKWQALQNIILNLKY